MRGKQFTGFPERTKALEDFFALWEAKDAEELVPLEEAIGRVTARALFSRNTLPVCRASACDGIAVRSEQFRDGMPDYTKWKLREEYVRADTGDDFDDRYDAVIPIEEVDIENGKIVYISPDVPVRPGENVRQEGSNVRQGDPLIAENMPIRPTDLASLATGGIMMVPVRKRPKVAFIPTGNELIPHNTVPARGQNVDTNTLLVRESLKELGAEPLIFPITADVPEALEERLDMALQDCDMVILNAGTAKGEDDWNARMLERKGTLVHHYIAAAPGRPMAFAVIDGKPVVNMPGPTMASFFGCEWCISACVARLLHIPARKREKVRARLMEDIHSSPTMAILMRMEVAETEDGYVCQERSFRESSLPVCMASNAMYVSEVGESFVPKGTMLEVELLRGREFIEFRAMQ
ncbi:MAG: molybdopterin molybdotransferase MoeA [Lachnospiraceae bacterium]|nr:molybdopterin molybdotransferase MoeA [Lachnospiraceae bacterium]